MYFVYIMTNRSRTLYIGVTNNLMRRVREHKTGTGSGFTATYKLDRLVYFERFEDVHNAIEREKRIKARSGTNAINSNRRAPSPSWINSIAAHRPPQTRQRNPPIHKRGSPILGPIIGNILNHAGRAAHL